MMFVKTGLCQTVIMLWNWIDFVLCHIFMRWELILLNDVVFKNKFGLKVVFENDCYQTSASNINFLETTFLGTSLPESLISD